MELQNIYEEIEESKLSIPVDVSSLANNLGIEIKEEPMDDAISGHISRVSEYAYRIVVNSTHHENRKRFTIAHEIGHFLFDDDILEDNKKICDEKLFRSGQGCSTLNQERETRANRFAASLLMPTKKVRENRTKTPRELAEAFQVSEAAIGIRLKSLVIEP